jgi:chromodomain-helicase-DNA-binding protein 7
MFDKASLKLGLDKAVLQSMSGRENAANGVRHTHSSHTVK